MPTASRSAFRRVHLADLDRYLDKYPHQLSGGQLQRVVLARALVLTPRFLVADEPVSMLDVSVRAGILALMREVRDAMGLTAVYISHDLALVRYLCERTLVMYLGRIVEDGPTDEIVRRPRHPYTQALVAAVPVPDADQSRAPLPINGNVPDAREPPSGCSFRDRCPHAMARCAEETPPLRPGCRRPPRGLPSRPWHKISAAMPDASPQERPDSACDPVTLEIVRGAIRAAQAEMEALIERTAISAFIREKKDFYTALFDADGVMAVGSNLPVFGDICGPVFRDFPPDTMREGDLYWYNDCYGSRGAVSHSNDQVLLAPVFHDGRRCGFVMGWAHFSDIGGLRAGSISPDTTDIFQEGIIVPPTKLIDAGRTNEATLKIFHRNSRFPEQNLGDMRALMASTALGVKRIEEIVARFGADCRGRCAAPAAGAHAQPGADQARRDLRLRHSPLHRCHRFRRPRQRPVPHPPRADARTGPGRRGPLHLRRHRDRRPVAGAGEPADESRRAGHGARPFLSRRRSGPGLQCRRPAGARRGAACARARCCGRASPRRSACAASP